MNHSSTPDSAPERTAGPFADLGQTAPSAGEPPPQASDVGTLLCATRMRLSKDLQDVAAVLHIRYNFLVAIEDGRYEDLPGQAYAIGFVRAYADHLGLDGDEVVRRYKEETAGIKRATRYEYPIPAPESGIPSGALLLIAVVLGMMVYGVWYSMADADRRAADVIQEVPERLAALLKDETAVTEPVAPTPEAETDVAELAPVDDAEPEAPLETPVAAPAQADQKPAATAPVQVAAVPPAPQVQTPPVQTPPVQTPPVQTPQAQTPAPPAKAVAPVVQPAAPAPTTAAPATATPKPAPSAPVVAATPQATPPPVITTPAATTPAATTPAAPAPKAPTATAPPTTAAAPATPAAKPTATPPVQTPSPAPTSVAAAPTAPAPTSSPSPTAQKPPAATAPSTPVAASVPPPAAKAPSTAAPAPTPAPKTEPATPPPVTSRAAVLAAKPPAATGGRNAVELRAKSDSWIQVRDGEQLLLTRFLRKGEVYKVPERSGLTLMTLNAGGIEIMVDGELMPSLGDPGSVARGVTLDAQKLKAQPKPAPARPAAEPPANE